MRVDCAEWGQVQRSVAVSAANRWADTTSRSMGKTPRSRRPVPAFSERTVPCSLPTPAGPGRPREIDLRRVVNALRYASRTGCQWRLLPKEFPNWNTVRYSFDH